MVCRMSYVIGVTDEICSARTSIWNSVSSIINWGKYTSECVMYVSVHIIWRYENTLVRVVYTLHIVYEKQKQCLKNKLLAPTQPPPLFYHIVCKRRTHSDLTNGIAWTWPIYYCFLFIFTFVRMQMKLFAIVPLDTVVYVVNRHWRQWSAERIITRTSNKYTDKIKAKIKHEPLLLSAPLQPHWPPLIFYFVHLENCNVDTYFSLSNWLFSYST